MKIVLKSAIALAALAGAAALIPNSALAGVNVTVGIGVPGIYGPGYSPYDDEYYYEPVFISGYWYHGPYRWQMRHGQRMFFVNGRWHRDEWRGGARPNIIMFRNGGSFRDGHNIGFGNAERINARFRADKSDARDDRRDDKPGKKHDDHTRN